MQHVSAFFSTTNCAGRRGRGSEEQHLHSEQLARSNSLILYMGTPLFILPILESAKSHYLTTVRLDPKPATAYNNLGIVHVRQGQISQAIVQFNEALHIQPDEPSAAENLRLARAQERRF
jgi:tetratricopeptide (TPR) repeat protein